MIYNRSLHFDGSIHQLIKCGARPCMWIAGSCQANAQQQKNQPSKVCLAALASLNAIKQSEPIKTLLHSSTEWVLLNRSKNVWTMQIKMIYIFHLFILIYTHVHNNINIHIHIHVNTNINVHVQINININIHIICTQTFTYTQAKSVCINLHLVIDPIFFIRKRQFFVKCFFVLLSWHFRELSGYLSQDPCGATMPLVETQSLPETNF